MKRKTTRIAIIFLLAGLMTASFALTGNASANPQGAQGLRPEAAAAAPGGAASAPAPAEAAKTREEVVYANLSATGGAEKIYAVTLLHPGGVKLYDYGDFENVVNLTDMTEIEGAPSGIAVDSDAEAFYYQADLVGAQLPWAVDVTYTLDGAPVQPDRLAGAAGALGVSIRTAPAARENVFSKNYMLTISVTLDAIHCQNIA
ncbi:MAG: hypothetical protein LBR44_09370, partial [Clostridiales Family XIII bacterium]|nr:hypothetical protein [Clostridiales Family XIII bacterium]